MASSVTQVTVSKTIGSCEAVLLYGPTKLVGENMGPDDKVYIYEETVTEGNYQLVARRDLNAKFHLHDGQQSFVFEGYGNYKFLLGEDSDVNLKVGYAN